MGATLVDQVLVGLVGVVIAVAVGHDSESWGSGLVDLLYTVLMLGAIGRTVGTIAVGTSVTRVDGTRIGYGRAFVRWLVQAVLAATVIVGLLDVLWPLWDRKKQTLHDKVVDTLVVRV